LLCRCWTLGHRLVYLPGWLDYLSLLVEGVRLATQLPEEGRTKKALANGQRFQQVVGKNKQLIPGLLTLLWQVVEWVWASKLGDGIADY
jgi:hypothetical protein